MTHYLDPEHHDPFDDGNTMECQACGVLCAYHDEPVVGAKIPDTRRFICDACYMDLERERQQEREEDAAIERQQEDDAIERQQEREEDAAIDAMYDGPWTCAYCGGDRAETSDLCEECQRHFPPEMED